MRDGLLRFLPRAILSLLCACVALPDSAESSNRSADGPDPLAAKSEQRATSKTERSVQFELVGDIVHGLLLPGQRVRLHVVLAREPANNKEEHLVAVFEGAGMARVLVPMTPDHNPGMWEGTAWLELPALPSTASSAESTSDPRVAAPQVVRIAVVFARLRGMNIDQFAKRSVYVTVGRGAGVSRPNGAAPRDQADVQIATTNAFTALDSELPSGRGITDEVVVEKDLIAGSPQSGDFQAYWKEIGRRITQRWGERARSVMREKPDRTPRVRFRLYPNGVAQTIYLERNSGSQWVDEAGLESVVDTQPFLPFPASLADPYVNVYVDFRPAARNR